MEKTIKTRLPKGRIQKIEELVDGSYLITQKVTFDENDLFLEKKIGEDTFIFIEAEKLSINDEFMKYTPKTESEYRLKEAIKSVIARKIKNFYKPKFDPSFSEDENMISFVPNKKPAIGRTYKWWIKTAREYNPEHSSRLGTIFEYYAFLGVLIKKLVATGSDAEWAWNAVCNNSIELGHYKNSENAKCDVELTGSRDICGVCDLGNVYKMVAGYREYTFFRFGGCFYSFSYNEYLSKFIHESCYGTDSYYGVGWIVLS